MGKSFRKVGITFFNDDLKEIDGKRKKEKYISFKLGEINKIKDLKNYRIF